MTVCHDPKPCMRESAREPLAVYSFPSHINYILS